MRGDAGDRPRVSRAASGAALGFVLAALAGRPAAAQLRLERTDQRVLRAHQNLDVVGSGVGLYDYDGDGDDDVFLGRRDNRVTLLHSGRWGLVPSPMRIPLGDTGAYDDLIAVAPTDLDGDGRMDLIVGFGNGAMLLRGTPQGLRDETPLVFDGALRNVYGVSLADLDGDGALDVYLSTWLLMSDGHHIVCDRDALFLQRGRRFVRAELPDRDAPGCGLAAVFYDADGDGDPDGVVANDFGPMAQPNRFLVNDGVDATGRLRLRVNQRATERPLAIYGMGLGLGDLDGDGVLDLATSSVGRAPVLRGRGDGTYADVTDAMGFGGVLGVHGVRVTWSALLDDLDGDGRTDLLQSGGRIAADPAFQVQPGGSPSFFWRGSDQPSLVEDAESVVRAAGGTGEYRAAVLGDLGGDGDPDLFFAAAELTHPMVLRNRTTRGPWLVVTPRGTVSPREARGSVVTLTCGTHRAMAVISTGGHMASMGPPKAFLSLWPCRSTASAEVTIAWTSGARTVTSVSPTMGGSITVEEPRWLATDRPWLAPSAGITTATVTVRPLDDRGRPLGPDHAVTVRRVVGDGEVSATEAQPDGSWRATLTARTPGEVWLAATLDGRTPFARLRIPVLGAASTIVAAAPPSLMGDAPSWLAIVPRREDGTPLGPDAAPTVTLDGGALTRPLRDLGNGTYVAPLRALAGAREVVVRVTHPSIPTAEHRLAVRPLVAEGSGTVLVTPRYIQEGQAGRATVNILALPESPLGDPVNLVDDPGTGLFRTDGRRLPVLPRSFGAEVTFSLLASVLGTEPFEVRAAGARVRTIALRHFRDEAELLPEVSVERSSVFPLQTVMHANGAEETSVYVLLRDREGQRVPLTRVTWTVTNGTRGPGDPTAHNGVVGVSVLAGTAPGPMRVTARLDSGMEFSTTIDLVAAPAPRPVERLEMCVLGGGGERPGEALLRVTVIPRVAGGVVAADPRHLTVLRDDVPLSMALRAGSYSAMFSVPMDRDPLVIRAIDRGSRGTPELSPPLVAALSLPVRDLLMASPIPGAWIGEERCVTATMREALDASIPDAEAGGDATAMGEVLAPDAGRASDVPGEPPRDVPPALDAPGDAPGGLPAAGCGCRTSLPASRSGAWWIGAALLWCLRRRVLRGRS